MSVGQLRQQQKQKLGSQPGFSAGFKEEACDQSRVGTISLGLSSSPQSHGLRKAEPGQDQQDPQPCQASSTRCCPALLVAAPPSLPTPYGAGRTGLVSLADTSSCQTAGPGSVAQAGSSPPGWLEAARLRRHAPTSGMLCSTHNAGTWWSFAVGLSSSLPAAVALHQGAASGGHQLNPTWSGGACGLIPH